jgi:GWxTD domain-containing protein
MLSLVVESALRSLGLALAVWITLRIFRVRDLHIHFLAWTGVLLSCLSMPVLMPALASLIRRTPTVVAEWIPPAPALIGPFASASSTNGGQPIDWLRLVLIAYVAVAAVFLIRLIGGLYQSRRLRDSAMPLHEAWTCNNDVRVSDKIRLPATVGSTILIPANWIEWTAFERTSVLLHETSHVRRRDFYIHMLAGLNRAIFWFSPLAWCLERHLTEVAEVICDDAAIRHVEDRVSYAEVLVRLTEKAVQPRFLGMAMARGKTVARRVERVLLETMIAPDASWIRRMLTVLALLPLVAFSAGSWLVEAEPTISLSLLMSKASLQAAAPVEALRPAPTPQRSQQSQQTTASQPQVRETQQYLTRWPDQEVPYIINADERAAFATLRTDEEREKFIELFWKKRDPAPDTTDNEFRDEYYHRIQLANERFTNGTAGWKTDRGGVLIRFGQPDEIETHPRSGVPGTPGFQAPIERWLYRFLDGLGANVILEFEDSAEDGTYRLRVDPTAPKQK